MMSEKEIGLSVKNEERAGRSLKTMEAIKNKHYAGGHLTKEEAMELTEVPLDELCVRISVEMCSMSAQPTPIMKRSPPSAPRNRPA